LDFDGDTYDPGQDKARLTTQYQDVWNVMKDSQWYTLGKLSALTGHPEASCSARMRDFRKKRNGGHIVARRRVQGGHGLHEYRLIIRKPWSRRRLIRTWD
jgi:hypothetical protein